MLWGGAWSVQHPPEPAFVHGTGGGGLCGPPLFAWPSHTRVWLHGAEWRGAVCVSSGHEGELVRGDQCESVWKAVPVWSQGTEATYSFCPRQAPGCVRPVRERLRLPGCWAAGGGGGGGVAARSPQPARGSSSPGAGALKLRPPRPAGKHVREGPRTGEACRGTRSGVAPPDILANGGSLRCRRAESGGGTCGAHPSGRQRNRTHRPRHCCDRDAGPQAQKHVLRADTVGCRRAANSKHEDRPSALRTSLCGSTHVAPGNLEGAPSPAAAPGATWSA